MKSILRQSYLAGQLVRTMGPGWLAFRVAHAVRNRSGILERRLPACGWDEVRLEELLTQRDLALPEAYHSYRLGRADGFFFSPADRHAAASWLRCWDEEGEEGGPGPEVDGLRRGTLRYFSRTTAEVGCPPAWHTNPFDGRSAPADSHWSRIDFFEHGDIKLIWEASRFGFVYPLVRAYWRTGDESFAELFWMTVEDWGAKNLPQRGANWKCGQEISFRVMAWCFGLHGFLDAAATTATRLAYLARMIAVSGRRIEANIDYAISQQNNHGISEGLGLWTIGLLFPEFRQASRWRDRGRRVLEQQGRSLIYDDGAFAQHSMNYHRVMLHDYLWSLRLGQIHEQPLSDDIHARVGRAGEFLYQVQDPETGRVPRYGADDGALVLPLNNCAYQDFRPVTQAAGMLRDGTRWHPEGPWDEDLFWLFGPASLQKPVAPPPRIDLQADSGGYYTLRSPSSFAFTRCCTSFRHRPAQADLLHVDLWWRGQNIALDPGTYCYNSPSPWDNGLARTCYHNTVGVDGADQMDRVSRFLWLPWPHGRKLHQLVSVGGRIGYWEGEHDGYKRLSRPVAHRRALLRLGDENWLVLDDLRSRAAHDYRLHWLFPDLPYEWSDRGRLAEKPSSEQGRLVLETLAGPYVVQFGCRDAIGEATLVRADDRSPEGWLSAFYLDRKPALSAALTCRSERSQFWTWLGPPGRTIALEGDRIRLSGQGWEAVVLWGDGDGGALVRDVVFEAEIGESLRIE